MKMREKILEKINSKEWKFHELLKLSEATDVVAEEIYQEMTPHEQLTLVWNENVMVEKVRAFGTFFKEIVMAALHKEIMKAFQEKFEDATVNFDMPAQRPTAPPPPPPPLNEKSSKDESLEDLAAGKDVKLVEKDGIVSTRMGDVKVKRV
jgi:hypothetical protein